MEIVYIQIFIVLTISICQLLTAELPIFDAVSQSLPM